MSCGGRSGGMEYWARCYGLSSPYTNGLRVWSALPVVEFVRVCRGCKSDLFSVRVGLRQCCSLSPILFITFMDRISRHSQGAEGFQFSGVSMLSLLFADDVVLLTPSGGDPQFSLERFAAKCEAAGMRISTSKSEREFSAPSLCTLPYR